MGHAAFGYLLYSLCTRWRYNRPPVGLAVLALGLGTRFPDLVDKPLVWALSVLPYGRSFAHSLFAFGIVTALLWALFRHPSQRELSAAFNLGYVSYLIGDGVGPVLGRDYVELGYLLWPLTPVPEAGDSPDFLDSSSRLSSTPNILIGGVLVGLSLVLWIHDGMPGIADLLSRQHEDG